MNKIILKLNCFKPEVHIDSQKTEYNSVSDALKAIAKLGISNHSIVY